MKLKFLVLFYRELAQFLAADIPLIEALESLENRSTFQKKIIRSLLTTIAAGESFSRALQAHSHFFPNTHVALVQIGELSGQMPEILQLMATWTERQLRFQHEYRQALFYPTLTLVSTIVMLVLLIQVMLPAMTTLYSQFHQPLPAATLTFSHYIQVFQSTGVWILSFTILVLLLLRYWLPQWPQLQRIIHNGLYHCPGIRQLLCFKLSRESSTLLALLLRHHIHLIQAFQILQHTQKNQLIQDQLGRIQSLLRSGSSLTEAVNITSCFSRPLIHAIETGEKIGQLPTLLELAQIHLEERFNRLLRYCIRCIEPITLLLLSMMIAYLAYLFYQPLLSLQMF